jgi:predicted SnoaL-like aldol condensation-catalyzing enzyme
MSSPEMIPLEERNKTIIRSFVEEIFNEHNLSHIENYFGKESVESSPQAGKGDETFRKFLTDFFRAFPGLHTTMQKMI